MIQLLLVEDDPVLARGLVVNLELEGYAISWMRDLHSARKTLSERNFQLLLLDVGLPDGSGLDLCAEVRARHPSLPIIVLTAQADEDSVVRGLQAGANDYMRKPFGNRELLARIRNVLREPQRRETQMRFGDLVILSESRKVLYDDRPVELNRREFDILCYLVSHADLVVSREALVSALDKSGEIYDRTIDSHISHLRSKLRQSGVRSVQVSSVYGVGYRIERREVPDGAPEDPAPGGQDGASGGGESPAGS